MEHLKNLDGGFIEEWSLYGENWKQHLFSLVRISEWTKKLIDHVAHGERTTTVNE